MKSSPSPSPSPSSPSSSLTTYSPSKSQVLFLRASAGAGKTTLCAELVRRAEEFGIDSWHFCRWDDPTTITETSIWGSGGINGWLNSISTHSNDSDDESIIEQEEPFVFLLDALDEASPSVTTALVKAISNRALPSSVRMIITSRVPFDEDLTSLGVLEMGIVENDRGQKTDLKKWLTSTTTPTNTTTSISSDSASSNSASTESLSHVATSWLIEATGMNWAFAEQVTAEGSQVVEELSESGEHLVTALSSIYDGRACAVWPSSKAWDEDASLISLFAAAYPDPVEPWMIGKAPLNAESWKRLQLFLDTEDRRLFHRSWVEWVTEEGRAGSPVSVKEGHAALARQGLLSWRRETGAALRVVADAVASEVPQLIDQVSSQVVNSWEWMTVKAKEQGWEAVAVDCHLVGGEAARTGRIIRAVSRQGLPGVASALMMHGSPSIRSEVAGQVGTEPLWRWASFSENLDLRLLGHEDRVNVVGTAGSEWIFSGSADSKTSLRAWNARTGALVHSWQEHMFGVNCLAILHDGDVIASAGSDHYIRLWSTRSGTLSSVLGGHSLAVTGLVALSDSRLVSSGADQTIKLWVRNAATRAWREELTIKTDSKVLALTSLEDGSRVVAGGSDGTLSIYKLDGVFDSRTKAVVPDQVKLPSDSGELTALAVGAGGTIATGCSRGKISLFKKKLWRWKQVSEFADPSGQVKALAFMRDGASLVSGGPDAIVRVWDISSGTVTGVLAGHKSWITSLAVLPGSRVVSGSVDRAVFVWDTHALPVSDSVQPNKMKSMAIGSSGKTIALAVALDDGRIVTAAKDRVARVWRPPQTGRPPHVEAIIECGLFSLTCVSRLADGSFASGCDDRMVRTWREVRRGVWEPKYAMKGHIGSVGHLATMPDGKTLVSGSSGGRVGVWNSSSGRRVHLLSAQSWVSCVEPIDDKHVATGQTGGVIGIWDVVSGEQIRVLRRDLVLTFSLRAVDQGRKLLAGSWEDQALLLWDLVAVPEPGAEQDFVPPSSIDPEMRRLVPVVDVGDGRVLAHQWSGSAVELWNWKERSLVRVVTEVEDSIVSVIWHSVDRRLIIVGRQGLYGFDNVRL